VGGIVGDGVVRRHAQARQGRQARRDDRAGHTADPRDRHDRRSGHPLRGAQALVGRITGSQLLTFDSTEHTGFGRGISACVDDAVDTYLLSGTLPAAGTHCAPD